MALSPRDPGVVRIEDDALRAGFTQIPNALLRRPDVSLGAKMTYVVLLSYAWQTESCFPGQERMAADMGVTDRSVRAYLGELVERGLLEVTRRGQGMTNVYLLKKLDPNLTGKIFRSRTENISGPDRKDLPVEKDPEEKDQDRRTSKLRKRPRPDHSVGSAPATSLNGAIAPATPVPKPLKARLPPEERRRYDADRRRIVDYLADFARELGDAAPLASSVSRAVNLRHRAGVDLEAFVEALYHARAVTKERWAAVRKEEQVPGHPFPKKQAMAYFFAELEHALGLRELPETPAEHAARKEAEQQERQRDRDRHPDRARAKGPREWVQTYKPGEGLPAIGADGGADDGT
jgi:hypothetical protein